MNNMNNKEIYTYAFDNKTKQWVCGLFGETGIEPIAEVRGKSKREAELSMKLVLEIRIIKHDHSIDIEWQGCDLLDWLSVEFAFTELRNWLNLDWEKDTDECVELFGEIVQIANK